MGGYVTNLAYRAANPRKGNLAPPEARWTQAPGEGHRANRAVLAGIVWSRAREAVLTPEAAATPLAQAAVPPAPRCGCPRGSTQVEATRVAEWAGHSVAVLLRVYAKCLDGGEQAARTEVSEP